MKDDQLSHKLIENGAKSVDQLSLMTLFSLPFVKVYPALEPNDVLFNKTFR